MPTISSYFGDYNIVDLIKEGKIIDFFINHESYIEEPVKKDEIDIKENLSLIINNKTILNYNNLVLSNFHLTNETINFDISNKKNMDLTQYYLVLSQNDKEIITIKLINTDNLSFKFKEKLNNIIEVKGIIKQIRENEYPSYTVLTDESGLGSLICAKDNYRIEYVLSNNKLIKVKETVNYIDDGNDYFKEYEKYSNLVTTLINGGQTASITENYNGFVYTNEIELNTYSETNENYYSLNTKTNKIYFEMNAKGFDCK